MASSLRLSIRCRILYVSPVYNELNLKFNNIFSDRDSGSSGEDTYRFGGMSFMGCRNVYSLTPGVYHKELDIIPYNDVFNGSHIFLLLEVNNI